MNKPYDPCSETSIVEYAKNLEGKRLKDVLTIDELSKVSGRGKGAFGQYLELYFGIEANIRKGPDFEYSGIELKSSALKKQGNAFVAKERLSINYLNFKEIVKEKNFSKSSVWSKLNKTLFVFYIYKKEQSALEYRIKAVGIHRFNLVEKHQIKRDWEKIVKKVRSGDAHLISGGDTNFLEACTTGTKNQKKVSQPFSLHMAPPRRLALKQKFLTSIAQEILINNVNEDKNTSNIEFDQLLLSELQTYKGQSFDSLCKEIGLVFNPKFKGKYNKLSNALIERAVEKLGTDEWKKYDYKVRAPRVTKKQDGTLKVPQSLSFPAFKYKEIVKENWDGSEFREQLEDSKFLFFFWKEVEEGYILDTVKFFNMPQEDILEAKSVWEETIRRIDAGNAENLPGITENRICHVRPHGRDSKDTDSTPYGTELTKKCFWINSSYIYSEIYCDKRN